jgi:anthranilate synthase component I
MSLGLNKLDFSWLALRPYEAVIGNDFDTLRLFAYIKSLYPNCYFFESLALPRHQDRYYTIGFDPAAVFSAKGSTITIEGGGEAIGKITGINSNIKVIIESSNPYLLLKNNLSLKRYSKTHQGGLIGYFCYESVNYFEPALFLEEHSDFSNFQLGLYTDGLVYDTTSGVLHYYSFSESRESEVRELVAASQSYNPPTELKKITFKGNSISKDEFINAVEITKEKIREGYSFQAEVGFKSNYYIEGDKFAVYNQLRQINPSPYMFYVKFGSVELLGASPEILISCKGGNILTTPTAGTIKRGATESEDRSLARQLLEDPKEIAEHNMLVDLHRNDLARVAVSDSVRVSELMYLIRFSHVQHIVSNITARLAPDKDAFDVLSTILPGGVVTGAPKIETIKIIAKNEKVPRGPYGGAVGRFSLNGDCEFCLPIRSIFCSENECFIQTSAGIVYDSDPNKEYEEVLNKLEAMRKTLEVLGARNS